MLRSQEMSLYQLIMPLESAWVIMDQLGYMGKVEIIDYDPSIPLIARLFANYIKRCDGILNKLNLLIETANNYQFLSSFKYMVKQTIRCVPKFIHIKFQINWKNKQILKTIKHYYGLIGYFTRMQNILRRRIHVSQQITLPLNLKEFDKIQNDLTAKLKEIKQLIELTNIQLNQSIQELLKQTEEIRLIDHYFMYIYKEKQLYIQLNKLKMQSNLFLDELWIPKKDSTQLNQILLIVKQRNRYIPGCQISQKVPHITPSTYFFLKEFTSVFQLIVNTYRIARYREINPALFTIITLPFLFGIMFGDICHGFCLQLNIIYILYTDVWNLQYLLQIRTIL